VKLCVCRRRHFQVVTRWRCDWLQSAWRGRLFRQDRQCTVWRVRVTIVAVETRHCAVCMKLHVIVNSMAILSGAHQYCYGRWIVLADNIGRCTPVLLWTVNGACSNFTYFSRSVRKVPDFNQTWSFATDFHKKNPPTSN
jgi:hypothetical protein